MWYINFYHNHFYNSQIGLDILTKLSLWHTLPSLPLLWSKLVCSSRVKPQVSQYLQFMQGNINIHSNNSHFNSRFNIFFCCIIFQCRLWALRKNGRRPNETLIGIDICVSSEIEYYQKVSSHAQIWPQGAEKLLSKVNVVGGFRGQTLILILISC